MGKESNKTAFISMQIRPPAFWNIFLIGIISGYIGAALVIIKLAVFDKELPITHIILFIISIIFLIIITMIINLLLRPTSELNIEFYQNSIRFPSKLKLIKPIEVPYSDIVSVTEIRNNKNGFLQIDIKNKFIIFNFNDFIEKTTYSSFLHILSKYIKSQANGDLCWNNLIERSTLISKSCNKRCQATWVLCTIIVGVFIYELFMGVLADEMILLNMGANAPVLIKKGQWFRLFNSNFLHLNFFHFFLNIIVLINIGQLVERLIGRWYFYMVFFLSALGGAVASMLMSSKIFSVGASTALYGFIGILAVVNIKYNNRLPIAYRIHLKSWILLIVITIILVFIFPIFDEAAHAGGFFTGAFLTWLIYREKNEIFISSKPGLMIKVATIIIAILFLYEAYIGVVHFKKNNNQDLITLSRSYIIQDKDPGMLNSLSWTIISKTPQDKDVISFALRLAQEAVRQEGDSPEYLDTLATAQFLSGKINQAIESERRAISLEEEKFYASQLSYFISSQRHSTPSDFLTKNKKQDISFDSEWIGDSDERHLLIKANLYKKYNRVIAYIKHSRDGKDFGIIRFAINNPQQRTYTFKTDIKDTESDYNIQVLLLDISENIIENTDEVWRYWPFDSEITRMYKNMER